MPKYDETPSVPTEIHYCCGHCTFCVEYKEPRNPRCGLCHLNPPHPLHGRPEVQLDDIACADVQFETKKVRAT